MKMPDTRFKTVGQHYQTPILTPACQVRRHFVPFL